jgi:hypothetical protein
MSNNKLDKSSKKRTKEEVTEDPIPEKIENKENEIEVKKTPAKNKKVMIFSLKLNNSLPKMKIPKRTSKESKVILARKELNQMRKRSKKEHKFRRHQQSPLANYKYQYTDQIYHCEL